MRPVKWIRAAIERRRDWRRTAPTIGWTAHVAVPVVYRRRPAEPPRVFSSRVLWADTRAELEQMLAVHAGLTVRMQAWWIVPLKNGERIPLEKILEVDLTVEMPLRPFDQDF